MTIRDELDELLILLNRLVHSYSIVDQNDLDAIHSIILIARSVKSKLGEQLGESKEPMKMRTGRSRSD